MEHTTSMASRLPRSLRPLSLLVLGGLFCTSALAQPHVQGPAPGGFGGGPQGRGGFGGGPQGGFQGGPRGGMRGGNRAPLREMMIKQQLDQAGYTGATLQEAVLAFVQSKDVGRQSVSEAADALSQKLDDKTATVAQIGPLFDAFTATLSKEKLRVQNGERQLDTQIKFSSDKRLRAVLTLSGVIGDAASYLGPPNGGPGRGGGPGGPGFGGMGGRGMRGGPGQGGPGFGGPGMDGPEMDGPPLPNL